MVQYSNNDQTSLKNDSGGNEQTVDKDQVQQWVDRAIGNIVTNKNQSIAMIQDDTGFLPSVTPTEFSNLQGTSMQSLIANSITTKLTGRSPSMSSSALKATIENPDATQTDFDRALAGELNQLSFEERERTWDEIHGVAPMEKESPEFLDSKLFELQNAIFHIPHDQKKYYVEALNDPKGKVYVTSSNFQLQFLRAERFDAIKAATRLVLCCEKKVQFFGRQALVRPLQLSDLDAEEQKTLKGGAFQVLPQRDQSGRLIVIDTSLCGPKLYTNLFAYYKCFWYIIMSAMEDDEESQKRGIVAVVWWMHHKLRLDQDFDNELRQETIASLNWLPMRPYSSTHLCIDYTHSTMKQILARFMMAVSPKNMRYGIQLHRGTHTEVMYKLLTYGIPVDVIPITSSGIVKTKDFGRWIQRRRTKDQNLATRERLNPSDYFSGLFMEDRIELPSNRDVLLGTGKPLMKHPGNQNFRNVVDGLLDVYDTTPSPRDKGELTWGVVRFIQNEGGRFLKREKEGDWWIVASDQEARDKTGKVFVNQRGNKKKRGPARNTAFPSLSGDVTWNSPGDIQKPRITVAPSQEIADSHVDSSSKKRQKGNPSESHPLHASDCFGWCGASSTPMSLKTFVTNQGMVPVPVQVQARGERIMDPEHQNGKNTCSW